MTKQSGCQSTNSTSQLSLLLRPHDANVEQRDPVRGEQWDRHRADAHAQALVVDQVANAHVVDARKAHSLESQLSLPAGQIARVIDCNRDRTVDELLLPDVQPCACGRRGKNEGRVGQHIGRPRNLPSASDQSSQLVGNSGICPCINAGANLWQCGPTLRPRHCELLTYGFAAHKLTVNDFAARRTGKVSTGGIPGRARGAYPKTFKIAGPSIGTAGAQLSRLWLAAQPREEGRLGQAIHASASSGADAPPSFVTRRPCRTSGSCS